MISPTGYIYIYIYIYKYIYIYIYKYIYIYIYIYIYSIHIVGCISYIIHIPQYESNTPCWIDLHLYNRIITKRKRHGKSQNSCLQTTFGPFPSDPDFLPANMSVMSLPLQLAPPGHGQTTGPQYSNGFTCLALPFFLQLTPGPRPDPLSGAIHARLLSPQ